MMQTLFTSYKTSYLNEEVNALSLPLHLVFPVFAIIIIYVGNPVGLLCTI
jgi:hypothetical protein